MLKNDNLEKNSNNLQDNSNTVTSKILDFTKRVVQVAMFTLTVSMSSPSIAQEKIDSEAIPVEMVHEKFKIPKNAYKQINNELEFYVWEDGKGGLKIKITKFKKYGDDTSSIELDYNGKKYYLYLGNYNAPLLGVTKEYIDKENKLLDACDGLNGKKKDGEIKGDAEKKCEINLKKSF